MSRIRSEKSIASNSSSRNLVRTQSNYMSQPNEKILKNIKPIKKPLNNHLYQITQMVKAKEIRPGLMIPVRHKSASRIKKNTAVHSPKNMNPTSPKHSLKR